MRYFEIISERSVKNPQEQKARAEAQGFDTSKIWYHGTMRKFSTFKIGKNGIDELGPGIYFTGRKETAGTWGREAIGGRIIACYLRRGDYFDLGRFRTDPQLSKAWNDKRWNKIIDELHPRHSSYMDAHFGPNSAYDRQDFVGLLQNRHVSVSRLLGLLGYTGAYDYQSQIPDQIVIFNPKDARRIDAKFDPEKVDSERLLDDEQCDEIQDAILENDTLVATVTSDMNHLPQIARPQ